MVDYKEYDSPKKIQELWYNNDAIGLCDFCGMDDSPVMPIWFGQELECKWCAEASALRYHLNENTTRVIKKGKL